MNDSQKDDVRAFFIVVLGTLICAFCIFIGMRFIHQEILGKHILLCSDACINNGGIKSINANLCYYTCVCNNDMEIHKEK